MQTDREGGRERKAERERRGEGKRERGKRKTKIRGNLCLESEVSEFICDLYVYNVYW